MAGVLTLSGAGTGAGFIPAQLPHLELWYEARFIASPPSDGGALSTWTEKGGRDATAAGAVRPLYYDTTSARLINGEPVVTYDGLDDAMTTSDFAFTSYTTGLYIFAMIRSASTSDVRATILSQFNATGDQRSFRFYKVEATNSLVAQITQDGTTVTQKQYLTTPTLSDDTEYLVELHLDIGSDTLEIVIDGTVVAVTESQDDTLTSIFNSTEDIGLGCRSDGEGTWDSDIAMVVMGTGICSDDQKTGMRHYARSIYGANV